MKALVGEEWGDHGRRVQCVVVCKLGQGKEVDPIILLVVDIHPKILLQDLIDLFSLTISLWMVGSQNVGFDAMGGLIPEAHKMAEVMVRAS